MAGVATGWGRGVLVAALWAVGACGGSGGAPSGADAVVQSDGWGAEKGLDAPGDRGGDGGADVHQEVRQDAGQDVRQDAGLERDAIALPDVDLPEREAPDGDDAGDAERSGATDGPTSDGAADDTPGLDGPSDAHTVGQCPPPPYFSRFPIALSEIEHISVLGGFSPPGHVLPTDHLGVYLRSKGIPFYAPADLPLWNLRRVRYLTSPWRQGETDYAIEYKLCDSLIGMFGHLPTLSPRLSALFVQPHCDTYSTADETVEACVQQNIAGVVLAKDELLGTAGGLSAGAFDFDLYDERHDNAFVNPTRVAFLGRHAVCPLEQFPAADRDMLLSLVRPDGQHARVGEPRCGTMDVDVAGTAQGIWVSKDNPVNQMGDETPFLVLALDTISPADHLVLSAGAAALGGHLYELLRLHQGRVNRDYGEVTADGLIYCYGGDPGAATTSILLSLGTGGELTIERVSDAGASLCATDPAQWAFGPGALRYIR